jgi:ABC-2 type transport system permease protein
MLPIIFVIPLIQLLILVYAATFEMKEIKLYIVDKDLSPVSYQLTGAFSGSPYFKIIDKSFSVEKAEEDIFKNKADLVLIINSGFEKKLYKEGKAEVQLLINAINAVTAGLINAYSGAVLADFNKKFIEKEISYSDPKNIGSINITSSFWYNPKLNYKIFMLPGILVILVTIIGAFLTTLNIVREKEMGTIEQINVTPIKKYQFFIGKMLPFWIIAIFELAFGLTLGKILFDIPVVGSIGLLFGFAAVYLLVAIGIGLFFSTFANTQQQAMFVIFFFMVSFVMMSGIFTPTESMPLIAQKINYINPFYYFMRAIRMILLKGSTLIDVLPEILSLIIYAIIIHSLAILRYRKVAR